MKPGAENTAPKLRNAARCLICLDEIESTHRHDFRTCTCGNVSVDGGPAYKRRCFQTDRWEDVE